MPIISHHQRSNDLTAPLRRVLEALPTDREITLAEVLTAAGMRVDETVPVLARLVELGRVVARQERQADLFVRLYRQLRPEERVSETRVEYEIEAPMRRPTEDA